MSSSSTQLHVALAQTCPLSASTGPRPSDVPLFDILERNLLDAREWIIKASKEGADVIVFPEYFLQGLVDNGRQVSRFHTEHFQTNVSTSRIPPNTSKRISPDLPSNTISP